MIQFYVLYVQYSTSLRPVDTVYNRQNSLYCKLDRQILYSTVLCKSVLYQVQGAFPIHSWFYLLSACDMPWLYCTVHCTVLYGSTVSVPSKSLILKCMSLSILFHVVLSISTESTIVGWWKYTDLQSVWYMFFIPYIQTGWYSLHFTYVNSCVADSSLKWQWLPQLH